jgi:hypothetical protein
MARIYKATIVCVAADGTLFEPGLHYQTDVPTGGSEPDPGDVANGIWGVIGSTFMPLTPSTITIASVDVREQVLPPAIGVAGHRTLGGSGTADPGDHLLPKGLAAIIRLKTNTSSRSARGYTTPPPRYSSGALSDGSWSSTYMTLLSAFAATLDDSFDLGSVFPTHVNPVVYSRKRHLEDADPWAFRVTSATVNTKPHWRRSRMTSP